MQTALVTKPCGLRSGVQRSSASRPARVQAVRVQAVKAEQKVRSGGRAAAAARWTPPLPRTGACGGARAPLGRAVAACQSAMHLARGPMAAAPAAALTPALTSPRPRLAGCRRGSAVRCCPGDCPRCPGRPGGHDGC